MEQTAALVSSMSSQDGYEVYDYDFYDEHDFDDDFYDQFDHDYCDGFDGDFYDGFDDYYDDELDFDYYDWDEDDYYDDYGDDLVEGYYDGSFGSNDPDDSHKSIIIKKNIGWAIRNEQKDPEYFSQKLAILEPTWVSFYTHASWSENAENMGLGWVCPSLNRVHKAQVPSKFSGAQGESIAITIALDYIIEDSNIRKAIICSDSLNTLEALKNLKNVNFPDPLILDIQIRCDKLFDMEKEVEFWWCPSNMGIQGNYEAEEAAKDARLWPIN